MARIDPDKFDPRALAGRFRETSLVNRLAILAGILWAVLVLAYGGGYFGAAGGGQARGTVFLDAVFFLVALTLPLGLITLSAWLAGELARQRVAVAELVAAATPLSAALAETQASLRQDGPLTPRAVERAVRSAVAEAQAEFRRDLDGVIDEAVGARFTELAAAQQRIEKLLASRPRPAAAVRPAPAARPEPAARQPERAALPPEPAEELGLDDLLRAFDFPKDAEDREGFRALGRALRHHDLAQMLQAAEDVMNLLAEEGVYMDDLAPQAAPPATWRAFAEGRRGPEVDALGGIRDERTLEVVKGLMKSDPIFRDTALFFQRRFDNVLGDLASRLDDDALARLADTRSARAFMLSARASGSFG